MKRFAASITDYTRAIALDPTDARAYFERGNVHVDRRELVAAFSDYSISLKLNPNQPIALYNRAIAARIMGDPKQAERDFRSALALDPSLGRREKYTISPSFIGDLIILRSSSTTP